MREGEIEMIWEMAQFARQGSAPVPLWRLRQILEDKIRHYQIELAWAQRDLQDVERRIAAEEAAHEADQTGTTETSADATCAA